MRFKNSKVFLLIPSITLYLPKDFMNTTSLYFNLERSTYTLYNRIFKRAPDKEVFLAFSVGTSSERLQAQEDFIRYSTYSLSAGVEKKVKKNFSLGGSLKTEYREGLYRRNGVEVYGRYLW